MKRWAGLVVVGAMLAWARIPAAVAQGPGSGARGLQPMAADADPSFVVATIKPSDPDHPLESDANPIGHRSVLAGTSVRQLLAFAYNVHDTQIADGPAWLTNRYDIVGVADEAGTPSLEQLKTMEKKLLMERFRLKFHWETRVMSAYVMTVAKGGAKVDRIKGAGGPPSFRGRPDQGMTGRNLTMVEFAQLLQSGIMDRPVVDHTGLVETYNLTLRWTPDQTEFGGKLRAGTERADAPAGIFTALREQLGLRLGVEKVPLDVMVIDRVERPSPN